MRNVLRRSLSRSRGPASVVDFTINRFEGLVTAVADPKEVAKGVAVDSKNWLTGSFNDHIELRPGTRLLGLTRQTGAGKITGIGVGIKNNGTQVLLFSHGRKVKYYDTATDDHIENGTNLLPSGADGEDTSFEYYNGIAGAFVYLSSPNSSIYKIPVANPGSAVDQLSTTYKGKIRISQNRMFLWDRKTTSTGFTDKTSPSLSYIDKSLLSAFTTITAEAVGGSGSNRTGTLAAKAAGAKRTCFSVVFTDAGTGEIMKDDKNGAMVGTLGGTGTINYATMDYNITFNGAATTVTVDYQWEDATSTGIADFSFSGTRTAGQGNYFRQDDGGGNLMSVLSFNSKEYCLHELKTWLLTIGLDDTTATNLIYRAKVGIPFHRAAIATGDGIIHLDYTDKNNPKIRRLEFNQYSTEVVPAELSDVLDLSPYAFDYALVWDWGNYEIVCCQAKTLGTADTFNSVMFVRNKKSKTWDRLDYPASCLANYVGKLYAGDPISNNIFELFSGYDDDGSIIDNYWISGQMNLGVDGRKKFYKFEIDGYINTSQSLEIYVSYDNGVFTKIGTIIGSASYVDLNLGTTVGSTTVGSDVLGSSGSSNAFHFGREFVVASDQFEYAQVKFVAIEIGALQINYFKFKDIRFKGRKKMPAYVV